jgi:hypothetical protein
MRHELVNNNPFVGYAYPHIKATIMTSLEKVRATRLWLKGSRV